MMIASRSPKEKYEVTVPPDSTRELGWRGVAKGMQNVAGDRELKYV